MCICLCVLWNYTSHVDILVDTMLPVEKALAAGFHLKYFVMYSSPGETLALGYGSAFKTAVNQWSK